jgi:hypothetical protein
MKKVARAVILLTFITCLTGCSLLGAKNKVYITTDTIGGTLFTVKFTETFDNAGNYINKYSSNTGTISAAGYTWYIYEIANGSYDVYIEWDNAIGFNGRATVTLDSSSDSNTWAAVYADDGGNVWSEQGGGSFAPSLYHYP